jgi:hypothetical protein
VTCDACGKTLTVGEWPYCPHGAGAQNVIADEVPGGFVVENGFDRPTTFYSKSEHRAALKAQGMQIAAKWAGPHDRHLKRWDAPSAKALEDAKILLERGAQARRERAQRWTRADAYVDVTVGEAFRVTICED